MSAVLPVAVLRSISAPWWLALAGLAAMFLPSYWVASQTLWQLEDNSHAPIILVVSLWLLWRVREQARAVPSQPAPILGWSMFTIGVGLYMLGRTFAVASVEFLSQPILVAAVVLLLTGPAALRAAWFGVAYLFFMVPLPATLLDAATGPLKQWVSVIVVDLLHAVGYPISRAGVMITIGPYQLLVADACSGLNSMVSLAALGALFLYLAARQDRLHNALLIAAVLPIAFVANVVRVIALVLITFHAGDEAGQGFLHGAAGIALVLVALFAFIALDTVLWRLRAWRIGAKARPRGR